MTMMMMIDQFNTFRVGFGDDDDDDDDGPIRHLQGDAAADEDDDDVDDETFRDLQGGF